MSRIVGGPLMICRLINEQDSPRCRRSQDARVMSDVIEVPVTFTHPEAPRAPAPVPPRTAKRVSRPADARSGGRSLRRQ